MVYLTDKVQQEQISDPVTQKALVVVSTRDIAREEAARLLRPGFACSARSDEAAAALCGELGLSSPLVRVSPTFQPGDLAVVGGLVEGRLAALDLYTFAQP